MGWRDRDWAKFDEEETRALLGPSRIGPRSGTARRVTGGATLLAVGVSAASIIFFAHLHEIGRPGRRAAQVLSPSPSVVARAPSDVVAINWSVADTMPAPQAGRICVTDALHGQICASYVVGERPADNLTREIERRGLRVQSSG